MCLSSKPHLLCHVQYVGNLKLENCTGISVTKRQVMLLSPADGPSAECGLMLTGRKQCGVMGQNHNPSMEAKGRCSSLWKCRDLLVWAWAGRVETSLHKLSWSQNPSGSPSPWGQGCWDILSAAREKKSLEACADLAEIPGEKAASRENRICAIGMKELTGWLQEDTDLRQDLCGRRNLVFHPHSMGWNRQGVIYRYIPECWEYTYIKQKAAREKQPSVVTGGDNAHTMLGELR